MKKIKIRPETSVGNKRNNNVGQGRSSFFVKSKNNTEVSFFKNKDKKFERNKSFKDTSNKINQNNSEATEVKPIKKPFDKKTYRLKKYSNKYKVQQWEDNRKKIVLKEYYKQIQKEGDEKIDVSKIYNDPRNRDSDDDNNTNIVDTNLNLKVEEFPKTIKKPFRKAQEEFKRINEEKQQKREIFLKAKAEKEEALKKYRKEKAEKFKKLSRRTKKGQPIMKDRMEMLLEKIQKSMS